MAEVSDVVIKRTQDLLGKFVKKPVLTDKLLRKPPFKFLHDIIRAVSSFIIGIFQIFRTLKKIISIHHFSPGD